MRNVALLTSLIVLLSGCGLMMMSSPKSDSPADPPRCSESRGGVILDGLFASTYGVGSLMLLASGGDEAALLTGLLGAVHVASAVAGYRSASRCTKAHEAHQAWLENDTPDPTPLLDEDREVIMGVAGSGCYPNLTCNAGLRCDQDSKLCVVPSDADTTPARTPSTTPATATTPAITTTTGETPVKTPAKTTTPGETPAKTPARTTPAQPAPPTRSQPTARPIPRPRPAPRQAPVSDEPWGDFWREVNP